MFKLILAILVLLLSHVSCTAQRLENSQIVSKFEIEKHIDYLCQPKCEGRGPRSAGVDTAAQYIADVFKSYCFSPTKTCSDYLQVFNRLKYDYGLIQPQELRIFTPDDEISYSYPRIKASARSANGSVSGELVFAGYGIETPEYSDYSTTNVHGKIAVIMRNEPLYITKRYAAEFEGKGSIHAQLIRKVNLAYKKGAIAVIFIADPESQSKMIAAREKDIYLDYRY